MVSVVIGTYNDAAFIEETVQSIKEQHFQDWEAIIVDNGSSDDTLVITRKLVEGDPRFRVTPKKNEGPSAGRNLGFKHIKPSSKYVHFLDGDDCITPDFLEKTVTYLEQHPDVGIIGCQFDVIDKDSNYVEPGFRSRFAPGVLGFPRQIPFSEKATPFEAFFAGTGQGAFALLRSSVFAQTNGYEFDFWSHEDSDIFCQMALLAEVHYLPDRMYLRRWHGNNLTHSPKASYKKFRDKWDYYTSEDPEVEHRIKKALKYYYGRHAPIRHLKVASMSLKEFFRHGGISRFKWFLQCLEAGLADLIFQREFRRVVRDREVRRKQP